MEQQQFPDERSSEYYVNLFELAETDIKNRRTEEAEEKLRTIIVEQRNVEDVEFLIQAYRWHGQMCIRLNRIEDLRWSYEQAFEEAGRRKDDHFLASSYGFKGVYHFYKNEPGKAVETLKQAIDILLPAGDSKALGLTYAEIARGYFAANNTLESVQNILEAIRIFEKVGAEDQLVRALNSAAVFYVNLNDYVRALDMGLKSLALRDKIDAGFGYQTNLMNIV